MIAFSDFKTTIDRRTQSFPRVKWQWNCINGPVGDFIIQNTLSIGETMRLTLSLGLFFSLLSLTGFADDHDKGCVVARADFKIFTEAQASTLPALVNQYNGWLKQSQPWGGYFLTEG